MSREIPAPVRAVAGLAATVVDETRKLPGTLPGLPLRVIGLAMQATMKLQQGYTGLVARGDELFTGLRGEQEPGLATFDDEVEVAPPAPAKTPPGFRDSPFDRATGPLPGDTLDETALQALPSDRAADAAVDAATDLAEELTGAQEALDELAIDEMVDDRALETESVTGEPGALENALLEADAAAATTGTGAADAGDAATTDAAATDVAEALPVDVPGPGGQVDVAQGVVTEEGVVAAVEEPAESPAGAEAAQQPAPPADAAGGPQADTGTTGTGTTTVAAPARDESVTGAEAAVDEAAGSGPEGGEQAPAEAGAAPAEAGPAAPEEGGAAPAEAGPAAPEEGGAGPEEGGAAPEESGAGPGEEAREEDAAIRAGADVDAVGGESAVPTDDAEGGSELSGSQAAGTAPVDGYDGWSIAQLRGRLRGYDTATVESLLAYEEATRARQPYVRMLRNRLERLGSPA